jgi:DNA-binding CsgD family transcriptional regulator
MRVPDFELLPLLVEKYLETLPLTPAERREVIHIAQGFACKDSATADDRALETIRSRRKRLYGKLRVSGSGDILSRLLALSLEMLARGERLGPPTQPVPAPTGHERSA